MQKSRWFHPFLLLIWTGLGTVLRCTELTAKPLWTDEFATIVFSLGHSFRSIPLNQVISTATLLQPLQIGTIGSSRDVIHYLMTQSTHPPLYFLLANSWMRLFPTAASGLVSVWAVRSLPVLLGVLAIPAMFGVGWLATRSRWVGHLAAALMAVSPFGVALAQEARHYTLAVLWVIASLACLTIALRHLHQRSALPFWWLLLWIGANGLGMATHYFFALTLLAEGLALMGFWLLEVRTNSQNPVWRGIFLAAIGTAASSLVWLPAWHSSYSNELTQWIYGSDTTGLTWLNPLLYTLASVVSMLILLPIQDVPQSVLWSSSVILLMVSIWLGRWVWQGLKAQFSLPDRRFIIAGLGGMVASTIAILLLLDYGLGTNLTQGFRYNFVYFPAILVLVAIAIVPQNLPELKPQTLKLKPRQTAFILLLGILGSLTVTFNFGYQKVHRPDIVVQRIQRHSQAPVLVAIAHHTHGQTGRLMGLAWKLKETNLMTNFYLDHQTCDVQERRICDRPTAALKQTIAALSHPTDLWLINFQAQVNLRDQGCKFDRKLRTRRVDGYKYQHYFCQDAIQ